MIEDLNHPTDFIFFRGNDGNINVEVIVDGETVWLSQKRIAELFDKGRSTITEHIRNIFLEGELDEGAVCRNFRHTADDGKDYDTMIYNLDVIISVGYRVSSYNATQFRIWATKILKEYMIKGFALDDERLKQGKTLFGKDYFDELLQRIREIRASERRFYQKVTDLYALSVDYDAKAHITQVFFATVQNKLEFAITGETAAGIIRLRADHKKPHMGLTTWSKPNGKIILKDVTVAKNYMVEAEIDELNRVVNMYLDYAENQAKRNKLMNMKDWVEKLDSFLKFYEYNVLENAGTVSKANAEKHAKKEYEKFRVKQDKEYRSDFDKIATKVVSGAKLPTEAETEKPAPKELLSDFNQKLNTALNYNPKG